MFGLYFDSLHHVLLSNVMAFGVRHGERGIQISKQLQGDPIV